MSAREHWRAQLAVRWERAMSGNKFGPFLSRMRRYIGLDTASLQHHVSYITYNLRYNLYYASSAPLAAFHFQDSFTSSMLSLAFLTASAVLGNAAAKEASTLNQLDTARIPQAAQRVEFGIEGDRTAFKFKFADPVSFEQVVPDYAQMLRVQ